MGDLKSSAYLTSGADIMLESWDEWDDGLNISLTWLLYHVHGTAVGHDHVPLILDNQETKTTLRRLRTFWC
jgi:hypothetical protein